MHQHRAAYELCGTRVQRFFAYGRRRRRCGRRSSSSIRRCCGECRRLFAIAQQHGQSACQKYNGLTAEPLYHPPPFADRLAPGPYGDYVLFVGRLESIKRPDLAVRAMQHVDRPIRLVMVGEGTQRASTEELAESLGVSDRIDFAGSADEETLIDLYKGRPGGRSTPRSMKIIGYVTLESFLAHKPVITTTDAGGPLEFVRGWRQRDRQRAGAGGNRGSRESARSGSPGAPHGSVMPGSSAHGWSPGTG